MTVGEPVQELTGTETGIWQVHTRGSIHILKLNIGTAQRNPRDAALEAKIVLSNSTRHAKAYEQQFADACPHRGTREGSVKSEWRTLWRETP
jgi:hypothetical protein